MKTLETLAVAVVLGGAAAFGVPAEARAGDGCVCAGEVIDCINSGGSQYDCALNWLKNPCFPSAQCWNPAGPNVQFAGNGVGGVPAVPFDPAAGVLLIPFVVVDAEGDPLPAEEVAFYYNKIAMNYQPAPSAVLSPPVFYNAATGEYVVEFLTQGFDPSAGHVLSLVVVSADGAEHEGIAVIVPDCPGDLNFDSVCDSADLNVLLASFGTGAGGDLDLDGDTDSNDLNLLLSAFGGSCLPAV